MLDGFQRGYNDPKMAMLAMIERLYDEIETDRATVLECSVQQGMDDVTRMGDHWVQYKNSGRQTVNMVIQRNV